eukprot:gene16013-19059_t
MEEDPSSNIDATAALKQLIGAGSPTASSTPPSPHNDENNVMRFFTKPPSISPTPAKSSIGNVLPYTSLNQTPSQVSHKGVYLTGAEIVLDESKTMRNHPDLECHTITIIPSTSSYRWGCLVAVNSAYICYVVKGEKIRVLERMSTNRLLIKDIIGEITDIQFTNKSQSVLSCATNAGLVFVFEISTGGPSNIITTLRHTANACPGSNPGATRPRVAWSPTQINPTMAVVGGGMRSLYLCDASGVELMREQLATDSHAVAFSASGALVAYGCDDGTVAIVDVATRTTISSRVIADAPLVAFVAFVTDNTLLVGSDNNRVLTIYTIPEMMPLQTLRLEPVATQSPVLMMYRDSYVIALYTSNTRGHAIHVNSATNRMDFVTEFDLKKPMLAFTLSTNALLPRPGGVQQEDEQKELAVGIFSIQSQAVIYHSLHLALSFNEADSYDIDEAVVQRSLAPVYPAPIHITTQPLVESIDVDLEDEKKKQLKQKKIKQPVVNNNNGTPPPMHKPLNSTPDSLIPSSAPSTPPIAKDDIELLSPSLLLQSIPKSTSPQTVNNNGSPTTPTTPVGKQKEPKIVTPKAATTTTPLQPKVGSATKAKTPSIRPVPLVIPLTNPVASSLAGTTTTSTTSTTTPPTPQSPIPPQQQQTTIVQQQPVAAPIPTVPYPSTPPQQVTRATPSTPTPLSPPILGSMSASEMAMSERLEKLISKQLAHYENSRIQREKEQEANLPNLIQACVKSNLEKIVKKEVAACLGNIEKSLVTATDAQTTKNIQMLDSLKKTDVALRTNLDNVVNQFKSSLSTEMIENAIKPKVEAVFLNYFQSVLVPGFEKSCMTMFKHLSASFEKGIVDGMTGLQMSTEKLVAEQLRADQMGNYADAFIHALDASNLAMVVDLCASLDPNEVFARKNLHNATIISIIQQFSLDLNTDADLKLKWIKECLFQLDPNDPSIAGVVQRIFTMLRSKIEGNASLGREYYVQPILNALKIMQK